MSYSDVYFDDAATALEMYQSVIDDAEEKQDLIKKLSRKVARIDADEGSGSMSWNRGSKSIHITMVVPEIRRRPRSVLADHEWDDITISTVWNGENMMFEVRCRTQLG